MPLRVTIELVPRGDESRKRKVAVVDIINDGTGTHDLGNYDAAAVGDTVGGWDTFFIGKVRDIPRGDYLSTAIACLKAMYDPAEQRRVPAAPAQPLENPSRRHWSEHSARDLMRRVMLCDDAAVLPDELSKELREILGYLGSIRPCPDDLEYPAFYAMIGAAGGHQNETLDNTYIKLGWSCKAIERVHTLPDKWKYVSLYADDRRQS